MFFCHSMKARQRPFYAFSGANQPLLINFPSANRSPFWFKILMQCCIIAIGRNMILSNLVQAGVFLEEFYHFSLATTGLRLVVLKMASLANTNKRTHALCWDGWELGRSFAVLQSAFLSYKWQKNIIWYLLIEIKLLQM